MGKKIPVLLFVEWKSENNYFTKLLPRIPYVGHWYTIITQKSQSKNHKIIQEMLLYIKNHELDFKKKYLLWDKDVIDNNEFEKIISLAKKNNISVLFSNPCFEVFLLLHYKEFNCEQNNRWYYDELSREMQLNKLGGYERNKAKLDDHGKYDELIKYWKLREYLKNIRKLEAHHKRENKWKINHLLNPYTNILNFFDDIWLTHELEK